MLKRLTALFLVLALALCLSACSIKRKEDISPSSESSSASLPEPDSSSEGSSSSEPDDGPVYDGSLISMLWGEEGSYTDNDGNEWEFFYAVPQIDDPGAEELNARIAENFGSLMYSSLENRDNGEVPVCTRIVWEEHWNGPLLSLVLSADCINGFTDYGVYHFDFSCGRELSTDEMLDDLGYDPDGLDIALRRAASSQCAELYGCDPYYDDVGYLSFLRSWALDGLNFEEDYVMVFPEEDGSLTAILPFKGSDGEVDWQYSRAPLPLGETNPGAGKEAELGPVYARLEEDSVIVRLDGDEDDWWFSSQSGAVPGVEYEAVSCCGLYRDLYLGEIGDSIYLFLLTEDGRVEFIDPMAGLYFCGFPVCAGPIYGLEDIVGFDVEETDGGITVVAVTADGDHHDLRELLGRVVCGLPFNLYGFWQTQTVSEEEPAEANLLLERPNEISFEKRVDGTNELLIYEGHLTFLGPVEGGLCCGYTLYAADGYTGAFTLTPFFGSLLLSPLEPNDLIEEPMIFNFISSEQPMG